MKTTVLGCGRWGSFLAWYCLRLGHEVMLYGRPGSARLQTLEATLRNDYVNLMSEALTGTIGFTDQLSVALQHSDLVLVSVAAQQWAHLCQSVMQYSIDQKTFVLCMKGLDNASGLRLTEVFDRAVKQSYSGSSHVVADTKVAVWLGPGHVQDFLDGKPNCMVIDSLDKTETGRLIRCFDSDLIRFYLGQDLLGNEVGAAAKNVIGIAAGLLDGIGLTPLKGALMTRGAYEVAKLIEAMGGKGRSAYGLAHLGDYEATVFSRHSQNRTFGEAFVKGESFTKLAEGVGTLEVLRRYGEMFQVNLPICEAVALVIHQQADPHQVLQQLLSRPLIQEFAV